MELIGHKAEPAPVPVMVGADLFQTQDVEEARQWGVRAFCENRLKKVDGLRPINARMHLRKVRGVGFAHHLRWRRGYRPRVPGFLLPRAGPPERA